MDVFTLASACVRRWWVFVPLVVITAVLTVVQAKNIKPDYSQSAEVILVTPSSINAGDRNATTVPVNPLSNLSTTQVALVARLNSGPAASAVAQAAGGGFSAVALKVGGIVALTASANSASHTSATLTAAVGQVNTQLSMLQQEVKTPKALFVTSHLLSADPSVTTAYPHRGRNLTLIAAAGVLISIIIAQVADFLLVRPRSKTGSSRHSFDEGVTQPAGQEPDYDPATEAVQH